MSVYGYGTEYGMGYRYPRRPRKAYIGKDQVKLWTKAAVFNTAIANTNPWVKFLREHGYYKKISDALQEARTEYYKNLENLRNPDKNIALLERQLETLKEEQDAISKNYPDIADQYKYAEKLPYQNAVNETIKKLERQMNIISSRIADLKELKKLKLAAAKK
jgi:chromosome segregation ATPase